MTPSLVQVIGFGSFLVLTFLVDRFLQTRSPRQGAERQTRSLVLAAALGGLIGAPAWWNNLPEAFAWSLPPLAAHYLGVAGVSFAVTFALILLNGTRPALRLGCWMLLVYLAPLAVVIWGFHLDRFDFAQLVTWGFFAIVAVLILGAANGLLRLPTNERGLSGPVDTAIGVATGIWGLVLFVWPAGPLPLIWPWAGDPLTSRLIGAMFLTVAVACWVAEGRAERRIALWLAVCYGAGIAGATGLALVQTGKGPILYLIVWAALALAAAWGLFTDRAAGRASGASPRG